MPELIVTLLMLVPVVDLKSTIVAPVPTNVPSDDIPTEPVRFVDTPVRPEPSPTNDVAVTAPLTLISLAT